MAAMAFGKYRTVGPDELAFLARFAIKHGLAHGSDGASVRKQVRALMPILQAPQFAILMEALQDTANDPAWGQLREDILAAAEQH